ncbi:hypothetical protein D3C73_1590470 [compost metagenome]
MLEAVSFGGTSLDLLKHAGEEQRVLITDGTRDLTDGTTGLRQQLAGLGDPVI